MRAGLTSSVSPSAHAFDAAEARRILTAGAEAGLGLRVHANQLGPGPGVQLAVELRAASVDHCTYLGDADVDALASAGTPQWSRCFPELNSAPARPIPMPLGCSLRASRLRWRLTAIRGPVTPAPCPG